MATSNDKVTFNKKELRGSRFRCLLLTSGSRHQVAHYLTNLVEPYGLVDADRDRWMPSGFMEPEEAKIGEDSIFLSEDYRKVVTDWWLKVPKNANTPNWDIASTCTIENRNGLMLVEAKAYAGELSDDGKRYPTTLNGWKNHDQIINAIADASEKLNAVLPGFSLSAKSHYQLCNRFAWGWKISSLGAPVILVYLGFLNAEEMADQGQSFHSASKWADVVRSHARGIVPDGIWNHRLDINGTPMRSLIRAMDLRWKTFGFKEGELHERD